MKTKRCNRCPDSYGPDSPCPAGLDYVHSLQNLLKIEDSTVGCPWGVNSADHGYCFWNLAKDLHGSPFSDKEICQLLNIRTKQLKEIFNAALVKLRAPEHVHLLAKIKEAIKDLDMLHDTDNTIYLPDNCKEMLNAERNETEESEPEDLPALRRGLGMPIHKDGKKIDIYGLYSKSKLQKLNEEKKKNAKKKAKNTDK
jgi:hypothetical protein